MKQIKGFGNIEALKPLTKTLTQKFYVCDLDLQIMGGGGDCTDQYLSSNDIWTKSIQEFGNNEISLNKL